MSNIKNIDGIINALKPDLIKSGWYNILRMYINSQEFKEILKFLINEPLIGNRFTPPLRKVFNSFYKCEYDNLKVVFIANEPYGSIKIDDGLAFSQPTGTIKEKPIKVLHSNINKTIYNGDKTVADFNSDLKLWAEQGVLLLNSSLTAVINKKGYHNEIWKSFINYTIDMLNSRNKNIIYVLFGDNAKYYKEVINEDDNLIITLEHPSVGYKWNSEDLFNKINNYLKNHDKILINW